MRLSRVWVALVLASLLGAAEPYEVKQADPLLDAWRWHKLPEFDGREPRSMVEGLDGTLWFGVGEGAARYDGVGWKYFHADNGLEGKRVGTLQCAIDGTIYAATEVGLFRFRGERWERVFPRADVKESAVPILSLTAAADGGVWASFGTFLLRLRESGGTLYALEAQTEAQRNRFPGFEVVSVPASVPLVTAPNRVFEDRERKLWVGLASGELLQFDPQHAEPSSAAAWRVRTGEEGFRRGRADYAFCQTRDGVIWIGTDQHDVGLNRFDPASGRWSYVDLGGMFATDSIVRSILETSDGAVWIGGLAKLFRFHEGKWRRYRAPEAPVSSSRVQLLESRRGDLWLLGLGDDVQRIDYRGRRWLKYEGLNFEGETPDRRQWFIAVDDGVVSFDGRQWTRHGVADGLMASPYLVLITRRGELWAAGSEGNQAAIARFDGARWNKVPLNRPELKIASIIDSRAAIEMPDGSLFFGAYVNGRRGGMIHYDPARGAPDDERAWRAHIGTGHEFSFGFATAGDGSLFSASYVGLVRYDGQAWERLDTRPIDAITQCSTGAVWVGTRGTGVYRYDPKQPVHYTVNDGLRANGITALFVDRDTNLWVGTNKGVSRFDGREWVTDVFPNEGFVIPREGGGFQQGKDGALWLNQFSREWLRRVLPGGRLDPATRRNFSTVRFQPETEAPRTAITTSLARVSPPGNTVISWRGVDPWGATAEPDLLYSHRLDGGGWSKFSPEASHVFLELPPGSHTFEVRARDRDLNVEPHAARVTFVVLPPVWRQPWFLGLMVLLTAAIATQTYRVIHRDRRLHAANTGLSAQVEERRKAEGRLQEKTQLLEARTGELQAEIEERKRMEQEVEKVHRELMQASHQAGMAEVATSVLHNIGNVLNSINVSATVAEDKVRQVNPVSLEKTAELLESGAGQADFLAADEKGKLVPAYLKSLAERWTASQEAGLKELRWLRENIEHVKEIVATQQAYAGYAGLKERFKVSELVEDAARINAASITRHDIELVRDYQTDGMVEVEKNKILQILVNLIRNAKLACEEVRERGGRIVLRIKPGAPGRIQIQVSDNGVGIPAENLTRIFNHGFTTRKEGHGFGLHSSANAAKALGGSLTAHSEGPGKGAMFTLELPL